MRRILGDIEFKRDHNEEMTSSYINIKQQRINNLWNNILNDDDKIDPSEEVYKGEMYAIEILVENPLMFLHSRSKTDSAVTPKCEGLKLGRMEIPKFSGDYFKWVSFRDLFKTLVVDNKTLPKAQQMQLLKTHVTGEAETLLSDLMVSEVNFDSAWQRLTDRFENKRVIVDKLINKLMHQPPSKGDAKSIKKLLGTTDQVLLALKNLDRPTESWDDWIIVLVTQKMGTETHRDWEKAQGNTTDLPTWPDLKNFLEEQFRISERIEGSYKRSDNKPKNEMKAYQTAFESAKCPVCEEDHTLYNCPKWKQMAPKERAAFVKRQKWCKRCLRAHIDKQKCDKICKKCKKGHSTWLHENRTDNQNENQLTVAHGTFTKVPYEMLLATAMIKTYDINGQVVLLRALIDSGSEGSLLTEQAADKLQLKMSTSNRWIQGLVGQHSQPLRKLHMKIQPRFESPFAIKLDFYVLKSLTKMLPGNDLCTSTWKHINKLVWADPKFYKKGKIDALLGMDAIVEIMKSGLIKGDSGQPMAQDTHLGLGKSTQHTLEMS